MKLKKAHAKEISLNKIASSFLQLQSLGEVEQLIHKYTMIAHDLNFNISQITLVANASHSEKLMTHAKVMWRTLGPIICGSSHGKEAGHEHEERNDFILEGGSSVTALKFALYVLTNDPKILYAPNGTEADQVISKVSYV